MVHLKQVSVVRYHDVRGVKGRDIPSAEASAGRSMTSIIESAASVSTGGSFGVSSLLGGSSGSASSSAYLICLGVGGMIGCSENLRVSRSKV